MEILKAENVSFSYDQKNYAVKNVSLSVNEGEYLAVRIRIKPLFSR